jgi:hypothetical protein
MLPPYMYDCAEVDVPDSTWCMVGRMHEING